MGILAARGMAGIEDPLLLAPTELFTHATRLFGFKVRLPPRVTVFLISPTGDFIGALQCARFG